MPPPTPLLITVAPAPVIIATIPEPNREEQWESTCPLLMTEMVLVLTEVLEQIIVEKLALVVVPTLVELFGKYKPQEEPDLLPAISLLSSLFLYFFL